MSTLDIKEFAETNKLSREDIAKILDSSIHTVNAWFAGNRNLPKTKEKILKSYIVKVQSINVGTPTNEANYLIKSLEDKEKIIKLLEGTITMQEQLNKMQEKINENATVNYHTSITLTDFRDEMKAFCSKIDKKLNQIS